MPTSPSNPAAPAIQYNFEARKSRALEVLGQDMIANMFQRWGEDREARLNVHASSLIDDKDWCSRQYVLSKAQPQAALEDVENNPARLNAIFLHGWQIHIKWQRLFLKYGRVVYTDGRPELDLTHHHTGLDIYYSPDAILDVMGAWTVVEIKGLNTDAYQTVERLDLDAAAAANETMHKALLQVNLYMYLLGLGQGWVLAEDKNTQAYRVWATVYRPEVIRPYVERLSAHNNEVFAHRNEGIIPDKHRCCKHVASPRARRCPMRELCFGLNNPVEF